MNDLDDLIRMSLHAHTPAAAPDDTLAGRAKARGRTIRRLRGTAAAALVLVAVTGVAWAWTSLPRLSQPVIAASPSVPPSSPGAPTPGPSTPGAGATVRDVSMIGAPGEFETYEFLNNYFASPTGNFRCFINTAGAGCAGSEWDRGVQPSQKKVCADAEPVLGPEVWGSGKAAWACGSDASSYPYLGEGIDADNDGVAWWDDTFGDSIPFAPDPSMRLAVLPYGKTLVAGDLSCSMAKDGVTCRNARTGQGFQVSRAKVQLHP